MVLVGEARRVGDSVLMVRREPAPLRLSESHAPEIVFGSGSLAEAAHAAVRLGRVGDHRIAHPIPPLIMMPTTSGTGADVSQFCIVTDTVRHTEITIMGRALVPDVSVVDPRLLVTMPEWLNAATGLDALTHGIEAFVPLAHGPLTDHHALQAIALVKGNLPRTMLRPDDTAARASMARAALEAGLAPPTPSSRPRTP